VREADDASLPTVRSGELAATCPQSAT